MVHSHSSRCIILTVGGKEEDDDDCGVVVTRWEEEEEEDLTTVEVTSCVGGMETDRITEVDETGFLYLFIS